MCVSAMLTVIRLNTRDATQLVARFLLLRQFSLDGCKIRPPSLTSATLEIPALKYWFQSLPDIPILIPYRRKSGTVCFGLLDYPNKIRSWCLVISE